MKFNRKFFSQSFYVLCDILYYRPAHFAAEYESIVKVDAGTAVLCFWALNEPHIHVRRKAVWHYDRKNKSWSKSVYSVAEYTVCNIPPYVTTVKASDVVSFWRLYTTNTHTKYQQITDRTSIGTDEAKTSSVPVRKL